MRLRVCVAFELTVFFRFLVGSPSVSGSICSARSVSSSSRASSCDPMKLHLAAISSIDRHNTCARSSTNGAGKTFSGRILCLVATFWRHLVIFRCLIFLIYTETFDVNLQLPPVTALSPIVQQLLVWRHTPRIPGMHVQPVLRQEQVGVGFCTNG